MVSMKAYALRNTQAAYPPGKHYHYSDVAYKLLGILLEAMLDQPYADILHSHILDPLGMTETHAVMTFATRAKMATDIAIFMTMVPATTITRNGAPWYESRKRTAARLQRRRKWPCT